MPTELLPGYDHGISQTIGPQRVLRNTHGCSVFDVIAAFLSR